eukprot:2670524-Amphidinium_carterae.1
MLSWQGVIATKAQSLWCCYIMLPLLIDMLDDVDAKREVNVEVDFAVELVLEVLVEVNVEHVVDALDVVEDVDVVEELEKALVDVGVVELVVLDVEVQDDVLVPGDVLVGANVIELVVLGGELLELSDLDLDVVGDAGVLEEMLGNVDVMKLVVLNEEVADDVLVVDMHVIAGTSAAITCNSTLVLVADVEVVVVVFISILVCSARWEVEELWLQIDVVDVDDASVLREVVVRVAETSTLVRAGLSVEVVEGVDGRANGSDRTKLVARLHTNDGKVLCMQSPSACKLAVQCLSSWWSPKGCVLQDVAMYCNVVLEVGGSLNVAGGDDAGTMGGHIMLIRYAIVNAAMAWIGCTMVASRRTRRR